MVAGAAKTSLEAGTVGFSSCPWSRANFIRSFHHVDLLGVTQSGKADDNNRQARLRGVSSICVRDCRDCHDCTSDTCAPYYASLVGARGGRIKGLVLGSFGTVPSQRR
jgi:hypothetical protein